MVSAPRECSIRESCCDQPLCKEVYSSSPLCMWLYIVKLQCIKRDVHVLKSVLVFFYTRCRTLCQLWVLPEF